MTVTGEKPMSDYLTVKQVATKHPAFSEASLRYYIFNEKENGLSGAIRRIGRKVIINEASFLQWIDAQIGGK